MTTVFAGLGGGEGVGASKGRVWPGGGGGPGWSPDTGVRDATTRWLLSSCCECGGTLPVSAGASWLPPSPCAGGAGLASVRGLAGGFSEAGLLLCVTEGADEKQADRAGAPVVASTAWDSDCRLSEENGIQCHLDAHSDTKNSSQQKQPPRIQEGKPGKPVNAKCHEAGVDVPVQKKSVLLIVPYVVRWGVGRRGRAWAAGSRLRWVL
jgi:hypothetical protein